MRFLIQRVSSASVHAEGNITGKIGKGILVFIGIADSDTQADADYLLDKLVHLRMFSDENGKMNLSPLDVGAGLLLVSQFTLYGDTKRGRRPSFSDAAPPVTAKPLYEYIIEAAMKYGLEVQTGVFQAHMEVELVNDGPVTFLMESSGGRERKPSVFAPA